METQSRALRYATSFDEKLLGVGCNVEIVVEIESGEAKAVIEMRSFLRSSPAFRISISDMRSILAAVRTAKTNVKLLESMVEGAEAHQLNYSCGGASLIVVQPPGKKAKAVLSIGQFSRESDLDQLSDQEVVDAISRVEALQAKTVQKVASSTKSR
jgi:hypothetical protein